MKILSGLLIIVFLASVLVFFCLQNLAIANEKFIEFDNTVVSGMNTFSSFKDSLHMSIIAAYEHTEEEMAQERSLDHLNVAEGELNEVVVLLESMGKSRHAMELRAVFTDVQNEIDILFDLYDKEQVDSDHVHNQLGKIRAAQLIAMDTVHSNVDIIFTQNRDRVKLENDLFLLSARRQETFYLIIVTLLSLAISWFISYSISEPIRKIKKAALDISQGSLGQKIEIDSYDEVGDLAEAFNVMIDKIQESRAKVFSETRGVMEELESTKEKIEEQVKDRTKTLENALYEREEDDNRSA